MSLAAVPTTLDDVDLIAETPCMVDDCPRSAYWRGKAVGCPHRHSALLCDRHASDQERELMDLRAARTNLRLVCITCYAPLHDPYIVWERL